MENQPPPSTPPESSTTGSGGPLPAGTSRASGGDLPAPVSGLRRQVFAARIHQRLLGEAERVQVGRLLLERELGSGGMGTVYEAWDTQLERRVALKFLRSIEDDETAQLRLYREAQGLARISHPNVVPVYDVGRHEGRVWIAMEYVPGQTLRAWAQEAARTRAQIVEHWVAAGRGLAAVHDAGLVHRDVKPDNVLLGEDGRVRLVDFGLVHAPGSRPPSGRSAGPRSERAHEWSAITEQDGFVGTPAYAAPEQRGGSLVDGRADQYSLCVCLWEALCGRRPGPALPPGLVPLPEGARLPKRLHRALSRGLALDPEDRFASVAALLEGIAPRAGRRRAELGAALVLAALGGVLVRGQFRDETPPIADPCTGAAAPIDRVWSPDGRAGVAARLSPVTAEATLRTLDDWATAWSDTARHSCEQVHTLHVRSPESLDRRRACLDRRLVAFDVVVEDIARAELGEGPPLVEALGRLDDPRACLAEAVSTSELDAMPSGHAAEIAKLRRALVRLQFERDATPLAARIAAADGLRAHAVAIAWPPLVGEAALVAGRLQIMAGDGEAARLRLGEALDIAERTHDLEQQAHVWSALNQVERLVDLDVERARWASLRHLALLQTVDASPRARAQWLADEGQTQELAGEVDQAEQSLRRALALLEVRGPAAAWQQATVLRNLGNLLAYTGRAPQARRLFDRARDLELGSTVDDPRPGAPASSEAANRLDEGIAMIASGDYPAAVTHLRATLATAITIHGPRSELVARLHVALAAAYDYLDQLDPLRAHAEAADRISLEAVGPTHPLRVDVLSAVGVAAHHDGRTGDAVLAFERALRLVQRVKPGDSIAVALAEHNLADALHEHGDDPGADRLLTHAIEVLERELGDDDPRLPDARRLQATIRQELNDR